MTSRVTETTGGILLVTHEPEPLPSLPAPDGLSCVVCGKRSVDSETMPIARNTSDGFSIDTPCCRHGQFITCPECKEARRFGKCPVCGCEAVYT